MPHPNILLIMTDQHRADTIGCAGDSVVQTPNLDRLAAEGVRFARAYCQGPLCMPARASFLTERYVRDHGVSNNQTLDPTGLPTFLQKLRDADYHTACIGKMHLYVHDVGRDTRDHEATLGALGFNESLEAVGKVASLSMRSPYSEFLREHGFHDAYRRWLASRVPGDHQAAIDGEEIPRMPAWQCEAFPLNPEAYLDAWIGSQAVRWLEEYDGSRPFFQWVGFAGPHNPWDAPQAYVDRYRDTIPSVGTTERPELPVDGPYRRFLERALRRSDSDGLTEEIVREIRRFYYANVTLIDEYIGRLLTALGQRGLLENTWIIYTTDHGEMLGDHGLLFKTVFYEPSVRVPLIVRPAGGITGRVEPGIVEHLDVPATLRAIAGTEPLPGSAGRSLLDHFEPQAGGFTRRVAVSENRGFAAFITDHHKLVVWEESRAPVALFDLSADPNERRNVVDDARYAPVRDQMMERYVSRFLSDSQAERVMVTE